MKTRACEQPLASFPAPSSFLSSVLQAMVYCKLGGGLGMGLQYPSPAPHLFSSTSHWKAMFNFVWVFPLSQAVLLRQQREERRRARLVQVREQERVFAQRVRDEVRSKREAERRLLEEHLQVIIFLPFISVHFCVILSVSFRKSFEGGRNCSVAR